MEMAATETAATVTVAVTAVVVPVDKHHTWWERYYEKAKQVTNYQCL